MVMHCPAACLLVIVSAGLCCGQAQHGQATLARVGDVVALSDSTFAARLAEVDLALVKFYAPWCGNCKQLAPIFEEAASLLKETSPNIMLAEVDCTTDGKTICSENEIDQYPILRVFRQGKFAFEYEGPRRSGAIASFMKSKLGPASRELRSIDDVDEFLNYSELIVIGFFEAGATELNETFHQLADAFSNRIRFGHTFNADICAKYSYKNAVVLFREPRFQSKMEPSQIPFAGEEATLKNLESWVIANVNSLVGHRTLRNLNEFKSPLVIVYYDVDYLRNTKGTNYWRNRIVKVAKRFADEGRNVTFAISNANEMKPELASYALKSDKLPVAAARDAADQKFRMDEEFSIENFENFVESFVEGKIKPYVKTEPIPETNDGPVKVVVGETFKEIVNDETKDVLLEIYSPMCGHCMVLAPKYEKLAIKLKDETDLVIAKLDGTANEIPDIYDIQGFPAIFFVPIGAKDKPVPYTGAREVDDFVEFLAKHSTSPLKGYDRKGKPVKTKKKTTEADKEL